MICIYLSLLSDTNQYPGGGHQRDLTGPLTKLVNHGHSLHTGRNTREIKFKISNKIIKCKILLLLDMCIQF